MKRAYLFIAGFIVTISPYGRISHVATKRKFKNCYSLMQPGMI